MSATVVKRYSSAGDLTRASTNGKDVHNYDHRIQDIRIKILAGFFFLAMMSVMSAKNLGSKLLGVAEKY